MLIQNATLRRRWLTFIVMLIGALLWLASYSSRASENGASPSKPVGDDRDYSKFSHGTDNHSRQACASCHTRANNDATPRFPGHKACTDCHLAQFTTPKIPMCNICHSSLSGSNPPLRAFPAKFDESFNVKFDHAQHDRGEARPAASCAACHTASLRRGVAMTIPAGINAHNNCYQCHTPGKTSGGRDISSCATCHSVASYRRTPTNSVAFNASFSHAKHSSKQRLDCADCHTLREGLPQTKQVSSPRTSQHFPPARGMSCATCHNNKRAFGEADYDDCKRCHTGATFKFKGVR
ncbi:MAG: cytochrome c3 family protein [Pyrinomonadaceae bacterium]|nr:cytochrome c3 family protein [Pyrinomonadaceae bacterium]